MRTTGAIAALVTLVAVGCGSESGAVVPSSSVAPRDIPRCSEVYTEGMEVTRADFGVACTTETDRLLSPRPIRIECEDDRQLLWNDFGWGFLGEPMTPTPEEEVSKIPDEALSECLSAPAGEGGSDSGSAATTSTSDSDASG